jgi:AbrB family looped-hinge helix DNA binding protein
MPCIVAIKATLTSKGQITIPAPIRKRLGLEAGQVLEFDETAPFLEAVPVFDEMEMRSVIGIAKGRIELLLHRGQRGDARGRS